MRGKHTTETEKARTSLEESIVLLGGKMQKRLVLFASLVLLISSSFFSSASAGGFWTLGFEGIADHSPLPGGGIVLATGDRVLALDKDGNKKWEWRAAGPVRKVISDGTGSVFAAFETELAKLDDKGRLQWSSDTMYAVHSLGLLPEGILAAGYEYGVLAFSPSGEIIWEHYAHEECDT